MLPLKTRKVWAGETIFSAVWFANSAEIFYSHELGPYEELWVGDPKDCEAKLASFIIQFRGPPMRQHLAAKHSEIIDVRTG